MVLLNVVIVIEVFEIPSFQSQNAEFQFQLISVYND